MNTHLNSAASSPGIGWLQQTWQDVRYGARGLRKNPGFTGIVVLTLALGVGANATIFSLIDAVLLEPPPYADPARLVAVKATRPLAGGTSGQRVNVPVATADFFDWRTQVPSFAQVAAVSTFEQTYLGGTEPEQIAGAAVSANFLPMLGVTPMLGRTFQPDEERPNGGNVVLLSHGFWRRTFAADPSVIGRSLTLDGRPLTIIGVLPPSFDGGGSAGLTRNTASQLWLPLTLVDAEASRTVNALDVFARLSPGATPARAQAELEAVMQRLAQAFPGSNAGRGAKVFSLVDAAAGNVSSTLWLLLGAVGLVLLIACSNVANLLFARASLRGADTAVRAALGATRPRLVRQLFTESLLLALLGCAAGLALAWTSLPAMMSILPQNLPRAERVAIDGGLVAFTVAVSLLTGITFGLAPAWRGAQAELPGMLKGGGRGQPGAGGRGRTRHALVVVQVALSMILLVTAGLLLKTFVALRTVDPGFDPQNVLSLRLNLSRSYNSEDKRGGFYERVLNELKTIPGVESAAAVNPVPFAAAISNQAFRVPGRPVQPAEQLSAQYNIVSADYFRVLRIRMMQGRAFTDGDRVGSPPVAIVNETLAQQMWPGEDPLGKRLGIGREEHEVVGVFADIKQRQLDSEPRMQICVPVLQQGPRTMFLAIRGTVPASSLLPAVRQRIATLGPDVPVTDVALLEERVAGSIRQQRFAMLLLAMFGGVGLALAVVGLYGVMSYLVAHRTREFGIRLGLGATIPELLRLVVGQGIKLVIVGLVAGVLGSLALARVLSGFLFGVQPTDPGTFAAVATLLVAVGALASYLPARRATRIDPIEALRAD